MANQELQFKCEMCLYIAVFAIVMTGHAILFPHLTKDNSYEVAGLIRLLASIVPALYAFLQVYRLRKPMSNLASRLQSMFLCLGVLLIVNVLFSLGGMIDVSKQYWIFVYTICAPVSVIFAVSFIRFVNLWIDETRK